MPPAGYVTRRSIRRRRLVDASSSRSISRRQRGYAIRPSGSIGVSNAWGARKARSERLGDTTSLLPLRKSRTIYASLDDDARRPHVLFSTGL